MLFLVDVSLKSQEETAYSKQDNSGAGDLQKDCLQVWGIEDPLVFYKGCYYP